VAALLGILPLPLAFSFPVLLGTFLLKHVASSPLLRLNLPIPFTVSIPLPLSLKGPIPLPFASGTTAAIPVTSRRGIGLLARIAIAIAFIPLTMVITMIH
jgi:hypothetical protein